jgi:hypothetical protein
MWLTVVNQAHQTNSNLFHFTFNVATYIERHRLQADAMTFQSHVRNMNSISLFKLQKWNLQIRGVRCSSVAYIKVNPLRFRKLSQMLSDHHVIDTQKELTKGKRFETSVLTYGRLKQTYWLLGMIVSYETLKPDIETCIYACPFSARG